jgi:thiol-disulfide isomerase/thioredoxin/protocatechuate 3,4-dioxygenase beta subunit
MAGRVLDGEGRAVEGADVYLFARDATDKPETRRGMFKTAADGKYRFGNLSHRAYTVAVKAPGFARAYRLVSLADGDRLAADIAVRPPGQVSLQVRNADGKPLAGARVNEFWLKDANGNSFFENRIFDDRSFNPEIPPSDSAGHLQLPPLPQGASATLSVEHPDFVQVNLTDVSVKPKTTVDAVMHPGVTLKLHLNPQELAAMVSRPLLRLDHAPYGHPSTYSDYPLPFDKDGVARLTVEPGEYNQLTLQHADYLIEPRIVADAAHDHFSIARESNHEFTFKSRRKLVVHGRVVDETSGKPVVDAIVRGEVLTTSAPNSSGKTALQWMSADSHRTDEKGEYRLSLATGLAHVACLKDNFTSDSPWLQVAAKGPGPVTVRDIRIHPTPRVRGRVVGPDGRPAPKTVVRFRGQYLRWVNPTVTDAEGRFELQPAFMPLDGHGKRVYVHPLVAFQAYEPLGARTEVHLDRPETFSNLTLKLEPEPYERQLDEMANEWNEWEKKGSSGGRVRRQTRGGLAPELDCRLWLNVPKGTNKLADFRGRFVFLDFWTTWCGPCREDYPSVQLAYELYKDHGFTVIGVHDNSVDTDRIRKHVETSKMSIPVAVDQADGRTLSAFDHECGVNSFPSYLLVGPDGTILNADKILPGPLLRSFKIEIIRAHVMGDPSRGEKR